MRTEEKWIVGLLMCAEPQVGAMGINKLGEELAAERGDWSDFWHDKRAWMRKLAWSEAKMAAVMKIGERFGQGENLQTYLQEKKISLCVKEEKDYPALLRLIHDPPQGFFYQGDLKCLQKPILAVVGTRKISLYGKQVIKKLLQTPLNYVTITSGMMTGVDAQAHEQALNIGAATVAVLGYGLELTWPRAVTNLRQRILEANGLIMSEYAPWSAPKTFRFPMRNRIVAGMSVATIVVEAAKKSGSLITAEIAVENGREVMIVPGSIFSELSNGTTGLMKEGATAVTTTEEIMTVIKNSSWLNMVEENGGNKWEWRSERRKKRGGNRGSESDFLRRRASLTEPAQLAIYDYLQKIAMSIATEELAENLKISATETMVNLSLLELKNMVIQDEAGQWQIEVD